MTKKKNVYTDEFKAHALEMMELNGRAQTARDLGISEMSLRNWSRKNSNLNLPKEKRSEKELIKEIKRLEKENMYIKKINEVLKKSTAIFSQGELPPFKK